MSDLRDQLKQLSAELTQLRVNLDKNGGNGSVVNCDTRTGFGTSSNTVDGTLTIDQLSTVGSVTSLNNVGGGPQSLTSMNNGAKYAPPLPPRSKKKAKKINLINSNNQLCLTVVF